MERYGWVADKVHRRKMAREAARGVLPNSTETKIVVTGNARAWRTMLELRSSEGAELEIRRLAVAVLRLLQQEAPGFFSDFEIYVADDRREAARISYHKVVSATQREEDIFFRRANFSLREKSRRAYLRPHFSGGVRLARVRIARRRRARASGIPQQGRDDAHRFRVQSKARARVRPMRPRSCRAPTRSRPVAAPGTTPPLRR